MSPPTRSRSITDYIQVDAARIHPDTLIQFDLYLHFEKNDHVMLWRSAGDSIEAGTLAKLSQFGRAHLWIRREQEKQWNQYIAERALSSPSEPTPPLTAAKSSDDPSIELSFAISAPGELDAEITVPSAQRALAESETSLLRDAVRGLLDGLDRKSQNVALQIWQLSESDPHLLHGINVATYATLLALAFGKIDRTLLGEIALAGLLHDLGVCALPETAIPSTLNRAGEGSDYCKHVGLTLELIRTFGGDQIPERALKLIEQHHERFDGNGYPGARKGFQFDDVAQLIAMAELLEELCSGEWDGKRRTRPEAIAEMTRLDGDSSAPRFFNPELLGVVASWLAGPRASSAADEAAQMVENRAASLMKT